VVGLVALGIPPVSLNRLELVSVGSPHTERYHKISYSAKALDALLMGIFLEAHRKAPREIALDLDATDTPLHGEQEARLFHGNYNHHCYLPLYIFCGDHLPWARLRSSNIDASAGRIIHARTWDSGRGWLTAAS